MAGTGGNAGTGTLATDGGTGGIQRQRLSPPRRARRANPYRADLSELADVVHPNQTYCR
ncbi:hypothetical protein [Mycobacterium spongiae]|uniref:Uncharacterized protein n=1 Tax=Mycobacterium spongiae TaxID=886343 RepID=A0A975PWF9_9MYCO|nr:hypothetical protein [Mycobacterium spongiae]QUR67166.1 hypothetical protein F6B93_08700 [Mycobacterium spongiae]